MVGRALPASAWLENGMGDEMGSERGRSPHMIEPAAAVVLRPVGRAVAPPGEISLGCRDELAADVDPLVRRLEAGKRLDLDGGMADDLEQRLVAPDVAFERRDVQVAD